MYCNACFRVSGPRYVNMKALIEKSRQIMSNKYIFTHFLIIFFDRMTASNNIGDNHAKKYQKFDVLIISTLAHGF